MADETYYSILELSESASPAEIKANYRRLISEVHPDRVVSTSPYWQRQAKEKTQEINEAYGVLSDIQKRRNYDAQLSAYRSSQNPNGGASARQSSQTASSNQPPKPPQTPSGTYSRSKQQSGANSQQTGRPVTPRFNQRSSSKAKIFFVSLFLIAAVIYFLSYVTKSLTSSSTPADNKLSANPGTGESDIAGPDKNQQDLSAFIKTGMWSPDPQNPLIEQLGFSGQTLKAREIAHFGSGGNRYVLYSSGPADEDKNDCHACGVLLSVVRRNAEGVNIDLPSNLYMATSGQFGKPPATKPIQLGPNNYGFETETSWMAQGYTGTVMELFGRANGRFTKLMQLTTDSDSTSGFFPKPWKAHISMNFGPEIADGFYVIHLVGSGEDDEGKPVPSSQTCTLKGTQFDCKVAEPTPVASTAVASSESLPASRGQLNWRVLQNGEWELDGLSGKCAILNSKSSNRTVVTYNDGTASVFPENQTAEAVQAATERCGKKPEHNGVQF